MKDIMGDRLKAYEKQESELKFLKGVPLYARVDGRSFHSFTKGMEQPYDLKFSNIMDEVAKYLVKETGASIAYVQSDEISLCWYKPDLKSDILFNYKKQKLTSVISALATAKFLSLAMVEFKEKCDKCLPVFDCRLFNIPNTTELMNCFLWRYKDAIKNSVQMLARTYFSHKELQNKTTNELLDLLTLNNTRWEDFPQRFKEGAFFKNITEERGDGAYRSKVVDYSKYIGARFDKLDTEARINFIVGTSK